MKTLTCFSILLFVSSLSIAEANVSDIACPSPQQLHFTSQGDHQFEVSADSDVIKGSIPSFQLTGTSTVDNLSHFSWNQFQRVDSNGNRTFTCAYTTHSEDGKAISFEIKATNAPWVQWCFVKNHGQEPCYDGRMDCILQCEMLAKH